MSVNVSGEASDSSGSDHDLCVTEEADADTDTECSTPELEMDGMVKTE